MLTLLRTARFDAWLKRLRDMEGKARILARLRSMMAGHFGDHAPVGEGVMELRIHAGPGYRIYYVRRGEKLFLLLIGGDKSTQMRDIAAAKALAREHAENPKET
jgi:putative addiction module killer protein